MMQQLAPWCPVRCKVSSVLLQSSQEAVSDCCSLTSSIAVLETRGTWAQLTLPDPWEPAGTALPAKANRKTPRNSAPSARPNLIHPCSSTSGAVSTDSRTAHFLSLQGACKHYYCRSSCGMQAPHPDLHQGSAEVQALCTGKTETSRQYRCASAPLRPSLQHVSFQLVRQTRQHKSNHAAQHLAGSAQRMKPRTKAHNGAPMPFSPVDALPVRQWIRQD